MEPPKFSTALMPVKELISPWTQPALYPFGLGGLVELRFNDIRQQGARTVGCRSDSAIEDKTRRNGRVMAPRGTTRRQLSAYSIMTGWYAQSKGTRRIPIRY